MPQLTKSSIETRLQGTALAIYGKSGNYVLKNVYCGDVIYEGAKLDVIDNRVKMILGK